MASYSSKWCESYPKWTTEYHSITSYSIKRTSVRNSTLLLLNLVPNHIIITFTFLLQWQYIYIICVVIHVGQQLIIILKQK